MIRWILISAIVLLMCSLVHAEDGFTAWGIGGNDITGLRLGYQFDNLEPGLLTYWDEDNDFTEALGGYINYTLPGEFDSNDISWIPDNINTINYIGFQGTLDMDGNDEDSGFFGPTFGMVLKKFIVPSSRENMQTVTEVQYINYYGELEERVGDDEFRLMLGMRIKF